MTLTASSATDGQGNLYLEILIAEYMDDLRVEFLHRADDLHRDEGYYDFRIELADPEIENDAISAHYKLIEIDEDGEEWPLDTGKIWMQRSELLDTGTFWFAQAKESLEAVFKARSR